MRLRRQWRLRRGGGTGVGGGEEKKLDEFLGEGGRPLFAADHPVKLRLIFRTGGMHLFVINFTLFDGMTSSPVHCVSSNRF